MPSRRLARCSLVEASFALVASFDAGPTVLACCSCSRELDRREVRPRPEVRVLLDEREPDDGDEDGEHDGPRAAAQHGDHEQAEDERERRGAGVRPEQRREQEQRNRRPVAAPKRHVEEGDHQQVARGERREERRREPPEDLAPAGVVDEVLRQPGQTRVARGRADPGTSRRCRCGATTRAARDRRRRGRRRRPPPR